MTEWGIDPAVTTTFLYMVYVVCCEWLRISTMITGADLGIPSTTADQSPDYSFQRLPRVDRSTKALTPAAAVSGTEGAAEKGND